MEEYSIIPLIPSGQNEGKPCTILLADQKKLEFYKSQPWFNANNKKWGPIYNLVVNQQINPNRDEKTPKHNSLQNKFMEKEVQLQFTKNQITIYKKIQKELDELYSDEILKKCFDLTEAPKFECNVDKSDVKFEGVFNWDIIYSHEDTQSLKIISNYENEINEKEIYKQEYNLKQKEIFDKKIHQFDLEIEDKKNRDKIINNKYEEKCKEYPVELENYLINKEKNEQDIKINEKERNIFLKRESDFENNKLIEICKKFKINLVNYKQWGLYLDKDNSYTSDEKESLKKLVKNELHKYMSEWYKENKKPQLVEKIKVPIIPTKSNVLLFWDTYEYVEKDKQKYEKEYNENYDKIFNSHYNNYRVKFYRDICKKYLKNIQYYEVSQLENGQYTINIHVIHSKIKFYCELKPTLGEDWPRVLGKMRDQILLTRQHITGPAPIGSRPGTKPTLQNIKAVLIVENFEAESTNNSQLIEIFKQHDISLIFTQELFSDDKLIIKPSYENNSLKLTEEIDRLRKLLMNSEERNKELENKILEQEEIIKNLNEKKTKTTINDYFKKK